MKFVKVLERLSNACVVAGREDEVRALMKDLLTPNVDAVQEDRLGNVIGVRRGRSDAPKVMIAAHMDEIGLMVKNVTSKGFIQFAKIGGIDDRILIAQKVARATLNASRTRYNRSGPGPHNPPQNLTAARRCGGESWNPLPVRNRFTWVNRCSEDRPEQRGRSKWGHLDSHPIHPQSRVHAEPR